MTPFLVFFIVTLALGSNAQDIVRELWAENEEVVGAYGDEMVRSDPAYRLPTTTRPILYEIDLTPYFDENDTSIAFTFDGVVAITIEIVNETNEITLHCNDLTINSISVTLDGVQLPLASAVLPTCDTTYHFLPITVTQTLSVGQQVVVNIDYVGILQSNMRGFYRSWYYDSTGKRWMGTTQFQPTHARQAFPCYDEPGFKAYFDITINREESFSPSISNMPIATTVNLINGRIAETFYRTPLMSTYLIAFIVSHYETINTTPANDPRPFAVLARDNAIGTGDWAYEVGIDLLVEMEDFTNYSYYGVANNMDMKQVAIPDFSAGAMENWGLLTYREALVLYDPNHSNHFYRQRVPNIVSHEITHMWFGNLVTCAWWDNLWLNEGFARLYQYFLTHEVREELGFDTRFVVEQLQEAMFSDSLDSAHALTNPATNSPAAVSAMFSTISYAKGAAIIRMTWHLLGYETYRKALRYYIAARDFDVAEPEHLFDAFDQAAEEDGAMLQYNGITVTEYFKTWSENAGVPVLNIGIDFDTGDMTIVQTRYQRNTGVSSIPTLYHVPITFTRQNDIDFDDTKPSQIITEQVTVINKGATGREWVVFNKQQTAYYRINYDPTNWALLTLALRSDERTQIHEYNRAQIVDDVFSFARSTTMTYQEAFNILSFLEFEDAYAPWIPAITGFNWLRRRLAHEPNSLAQLDALIIQWSTAVVNRLGFIETINDTYMDGLLRMYLMNFLCNNVGHPDCTAQAVLNFQNLRDSQQEISVNARASSYCQGLRAGTSDDFDFLFNRYLEHDLASEKLVLMAALGCTQDDDSLYSFLSELVADTDSFRAQDYASALSAAVTGNEENSQKVFTWLQQNIEAANNAFGSLATPISYIAARLISEDQIVPFVNWLNENENLIGAEAYNTGVAGVSSARAFLQWTAERIGEMNEFFETGYQEPSFEDDEEEETTTVAPVTDTPESEETVTEEINAANFISVSFMTIFLSLVAHLVQA